MYVWRGINLIMSVFFLLAAFANLNDADSYLWVPIYLAPVLFSAPLVLQPAIAGIYWNHLVIGAGCWSGWWLVGLCLFTESSLWRLGTVVLFTVCCAMSLYQVVLLLEAIQSQLQNPLQHEEGREMGGLLIIITWLGVTRFTNIARPSSSVSNTGLMSALLLMTVTLTVMPLFIWSLCFISDWHTKLGHCSGMFT